MEAPPAPEGRKPSLSYRFTVNGDNLYAIAKTWPGETATITSLAKGKAPEGRIESVSLLGHKGQL